MCLKHWQSMQKDRKKIDPQAIVSFKNNCQFDNYYANIRMFLKNVTDYNIFLFLRNNYFDK